MSSGTLPEIDEKEKTNGGNEERGVVKKLDAGAQIFTYKIFDMPTSEEEKTHYTFDGKFLGAEERLTPLNLKANYTLWAVQLAL